MVYPLTIVRDVRGHDATVPPCHRATVPPCHRAPVPPCPRATVPRLSIAAAHRAVPEGSTLAAAQRGCPLCGRVRRRRHSRHCSLQFADALRTRSRLWAEREITASAG